MMMLSLIAMYSMSWPLFQGFNARRNQPTEDSPASQGPAANAAAGGLEVCLPTVGLTGAAALPANEEDDEEDPLGHDTQFSPSASEEQRVGELGTWTPHSPVVIKISADNSPLNQLPVNFFSLIIKTCCH